MVFCRLRFLFPLQNDEFTAPVDTIIVTGGAGFLGSWFVRDWLANQLGRVVVIDKLTYAGNLRSLESARDCDSFEFHQGDIGDRPLVDSLLAEHSPSAIINFAAETHVDRSIDAPAPFVATNIVGTAQLLDATLEYWRSCNMELRERFRFIHISTDEVFGSIDAPRQASETSTYRPTSPYAASKASADHLVRSYRLTYSLPTSIVHPSNCYGPFQFPEKLIPLVINSAFEGRPVPIYGSGLQQRDWLWGGDLCRAIRLIRQKARPGESFNVSTQELRTNLEVATTICDLVDELSPERLATPRRDLITHVADRPAHDFRYALDTSRALRLGWQSSIEFGAGLRDTVRWYLDNRDWVDEVSCGIDRTRRLGLATQ